MLRSSDIQIRDPFVVACAAERRYYLYGTTDADCWSGQATGFDAYTGKDLENWEGPFPVFRPPAGFWATKNFWAPEVHAYGGRYCMLASFKAEGVPRGTQVLAADGPLGPFLPLGKGPVTPQEWECLDGTLFVDEAAQPWMVFCHEWVQTHDGEMCAIPLATDLSAPAGPPQLLFRASEAPWVRPIHHKALGIHDGRVTDGPFLHRASNGWLLMLWSSFAANGYAIGIARSESGRITGPWRQEPEALFGRDGGHGMLFQTFDGRLLLTIHTPNKTPLERPAFFEVREMDGRLRVVV